MTERQTRRRNRGPWGWVPAFSALLLLPVAGYGHVSSLPGPCSEVMFIDSCTTSSFEGTVIKVSGPDLFVLRLLNGQAVRVRLAGVSVPKESEGQVREFLSSQIVNKKVEVVVFCPGQQSSGPLEGRTRVLGDDVNRVLIRQGMVYFDDSSYGLSAYDRCMYRRAQEEAKAEKTGLWRVEDTTEGAPGAR